ncbi:MAG: hypothetical protein ACTSVI_07395 [Promethearchaeota archaeon]
MGKKNPLKETFERIFWTMTRAGRQGVRVYLVHRGKPGNVKIVNFNDIIKVDNYYIYFKNSGEESLPEGEITQVPFHRIIKIMDINSGKILYVNKRHLGE